MKYHCLYCSYLWISRKTFGWPAKCPSCNSKSIEPFISTIRFIPQPVDITKELYALKKSLKNRDWRIRKNTIESLRNLGDERAVQLIVNTLQDPDEDVREAAAKSLTSFRECNIKL